MKLQWPLRLLGPGADEPTISQPFAGHLADYSRFHLLGHDGIDLPAPLDTPVYAAHDGYLIYANGTDRANGLGIRQYFEEDGLGYELVYWHFDKIEFPDQAYNQSSQTTFVKQGDLIGYVDTTGYSTGEHLHFGLRLFNNHQLLNPDNGYFGSVDPLPYLRETNNMQLIRDNGTVFLVAGVTQKVKTGIASPEALTALFGDEPIVDGDTSAILETQTLANIFGIHKK